MLMDIIGGTLCNIKLFRWLLLQDSPHLFRSKKESDWFAD